MLTADRLEIFGVRAALDARLERGEALAQRTRVAALGLGERDLAPQPALLALHRLECLRDVDE
jgi:hypothetical protein